MWLEERRQSTFFIKWVPSNLFSIKPKTISVWGYICFTPERSRGCILHTSQLFKWNQSNNSTYYGSTKTPNTDCTHVRRKLPQRRATPPLGATVRGRLTWRQPARAICSLPRSPVMNILAAVFVPLTTSILTNTSRPHSWSGAYVLISSTQPPNSANNHTVGILSSPSRWHAKNVHMCCEKPQELRKHASAHLWVCILKWQKFMFFFKFHYIILYILRTLYP